MHLRSKFESGVLALGLFSLASGGCAAGISNNPHGLGAGEWRVTLPATKSYSQGLAYGSGGSAARVQTEADVPMLAEAHTAPVRAEHASKKKAHQKRHVDLAPTSPVVPSAPAPEQAPTTPPASSNERTQLAFADTSTVGRYEARQAQSQEQQKFAGGDAIVIGASTLVIVILIVLLVLLLV